MLADAVWAAETFAARRQTVVPTPRERAQMAEWQGFADTSGFAFDGSRMKLTGVAGGSTIVVALETEPGCVRTSVWARFPSSVGLGFAVRRTKLPSFLQGIFQQDIQIGHSRFDDLFLVSGAPEDRVRELLRRPSIAEILVDLGSTTSEVQMHDEGLFFRLEGAFPGAEQVATLVERGRIASVALFGQANERPYR